MFSLDEHGRVIVVAVLPIQNISPPLSVALLKRRSTLLTARSGATPSSRALVLADLRQPSTSVALPTPLHPRTRIEEARALAQRLTMQHISILPPSILSRDHDLHIPRLGEHGEVILRQVGARPAMVRARMSVSPCVCPARYDRGRARYCRRGRGGGRERGEVVVGVGGLRGALVLGHHRGCGDSKTPLPERV